MTVRWLWRLALECGHLRLSGPWDEPHKDDGSPRHMIGDLTICEVCPRVPGGLTLALSVRYVLDVIPIPDAMYRPPDDGALRSRQDQLYGGTSGI